jgi:hypothetical protein
MKYKFFLLILLFLSSCTTYSNNKNNFRFSAKGFAYISEDFSKNTINEEFFAFHNDLRRGTKIRITNPSNNKSLEVIIKKNIKYDNFYKILINKNIVNNLDLDENFPYVELNEIKLNKSFVAKKAVTDNAEKEIANKAPIDQININNISKEKIKITKEKKKIKTFSILVAELYSLKSAKLLKQRLTTILIDSNYKLISIKKNNEKSHFLLMGPYNTINKLKNDYITLSDSNFEDLDIIIND